jgi:hypothetical protein
MPKAIASDGEVITFVEKTKRRRWVCERGRQRRQRQNAASEVTDLQF